MAQDFAELDLASTHNDKDKQIRKLRKNLKEIEELEEVKRTGSRPLNQDQLDKINNKSTVQAQIRTLEGEIH